MKKNTLCTVFIAALLSCYSQGGTWIWVKGSNFINDTGTFGTHGVPNLNDNPRSTYEAINWIDLQGNFWIFGGLERIGNQEFETNNLWKYDPTINVWIWINGGGQNQILPAIYGIKGVPAPNNYPGPRGWGAVSWTDKNGDLWMFGGYGFGSTGGQNNLNDIWRYHIATNEWTWMGGSDSAGQMNNYGTFRVPAPGNSPSGRRECNSAWTDENNNLWFFGGIGMDSLGGTPCNDMWRYSTATNEWTWMSGLKAPQPNGIYAGNYGRFQIEDSSNLPLPRACYTKWKDPMGNFYIFGGMSVDWTTFILESLSDVWKYNPITNNWTWIAGDSVFMSHGNYQTYCTNNGIIGPSARFENRTAETLGCTSNFFSFGGFTSDIYNSYCQNDLWTFNTQSFNWRWISGSDSFNSPGNYGTLGSPSPMNVPTARAGPSLWMDNLGTLWLWGGQTFGGGLFNDMWKFIPDTTCLQNPIFNSFCFVTAMGDSLIATPAMNYHWYLNGGLIPGATSQTYIATQGGNYTVEVTDSNGCSAVSTAVLISSIQNVNDYEVEIYPNPNSGNSWELKVTNNFLGSEMEIFDAQGKRILMSNIEHQISNVEFNAAQGVYLLRITSAKNSITRKLVKM